jgi:hypothetical protein
MTPVPGIAAVEAAAGRQPLATLQALAEAVMRDVSPAPAAPGSAADTVRLQAPAETQAAQRPLEHLLQPAQLSALHAPATDQARPRRVPGEQQQDGAGSGPGADPDADQASDQANDQASDQAGDQATDRDDDGHRPWQAHEPAEGEASSHAVPPPSAAGGRRHAGRRADGSFGEAPSPEAESLAAFLRAHGPADAVADLARGRRVLLVLPGRGGRAPMAPDDWAGMRGVGVTAGGGQPAGPGHPAQAWLLDARRAARFAAWWSPRGADVPRRAATPDHDWPAWRLFRDGDPLLARGLASLATAGGGCRLRLGNVAALRFAGPAPATATLAIHDRQRFADTLGGQWSVVLTVAPPGTGTP